MKFVLCVPAYNEEEIIVKTITELTTILSKLPNQIEWHVIVANNGSIDSTEQKILRLNINHVSVCTIPEKGKGLAIRTISKDIDTDFFGFIDADLSADPHILPEMLKVLMDGEYDIIIGSRFLDKTLVDRAFWRSFSSKLFNTMQRLILRVSVSDTQCGLKIMNKKAIILFNKCIEKTWFFDLEFLYFAEKSKLKIKEVPVKWEEYKYKNRVSKLNVIKDGMLAMLAIIRIKQKSI